MLRYGVIPSYPANMRHWAIAGLRLGQRRRRWANISSVLAQCLVFAGYWSESLLPISIGQSMVNGLVRSCEKLRWTFQLDGWQLPEDKHIYTLVCHYYVTQKSFEDFFLIILNYLRSVSDWVSYWLSLTSCPILRFVKHEPLKGVTQFNSLHCPICFNWSITPEPGVCQGVKLSFNHSCRGRNVLDPKWNTVRRR